jgi:hypothetical protein
MSRSDWSLPAALAVYFAAVALVVGRSMAVNGGSLIYPLDDTYIHMAMAKNFAAHGVWGVTQYEFTSSSSSPLWTLLMAICFRLFGVSIGAPLALNILFAALIIVETRRLLADMPRRWSFCALTAVAFGAAMPTVTMIGMEHLLHAWLTLLFVRHAVLIDTRSTPQRLRLALIATLLAASRYEASLLIGVVGLWLLYKRDLITACVIGIAVAAYHLSYGAVAMANGWPFLPYSVLLKGNVPGSGPMAVLRWLTLWNLFRALSGAPHLLTLILIVGATALMNPADRRSGRTLAAVFIATTLLHLWLARTGWFYRYECYLLAFGIALAARNIHELVTVHKPNALVPWSRLAWVLLLALTLAAPILVRSVEALRGAVAATEHIFNQQIQMARLIDTYYPAGRVAINDLGVVTFLSDARVLDLVGLGSADIGRMHLAQQRSVAALDAAAARSGIEIAAVYDWILAEYGGPPPQWKKVAEWRLTGYSVESQRTVAWYAVGAAQQVRLRSALEAFAGQLPPGVQQIFAD